MKVSRRIVLRGLGGVALALPFLESLGTKQAKAADGALPFAIFFRQANGVAAARDSEPERFWPKSEGALTADSISGRALEELSDFTQRLLVTRVDMQGFSYGDGHARGALQCLTARSPVTDNAGGQSEASGESIDHRIGKELNVDGRDSLFMYAGKSGGWLGGPCISYRGSGQRRSALHDPKAAYETMVGGNTGLSNEAQALLAQRQKSVNDLVRGQLQGILSRPELSSADKQRLDLHLSSVRDLEVALSCKLAQDQEALLQGNAPSYDSADGNDIIANVKLHMDIAALAVACGYTRSVAIQVGNGNDGSSRYPDPDTGSLMADNFHYISHRRKSHDSSGSIIAGADALHSKIDRHFARMFLHLLQRLDAYSTPTGQSMLDQGVAVWLNDLGNGPPHSATDVPFVIAGSGGGYLKQGQYIDATGKKSHIQLLRSLAHAAGVTGNLDDFGEASLPKGGLNEVLAGA